MRSRPLGLALLAGLSLAISACENGRFAGTPPAAADTTQLAKGNPGQGGGTGTPLYAAGVQAAPVPPGDRRAAFSSADPIIIHNCRLSVFIKQEVPAERDGKLAWIGTPMKDGEIFPEDRIFFVPREGSTIPQEANVVPAHVTMASGLVTAEISPSSSAMPLRLASHLSNVLVAGNPNAGQLERYRKIKEGDRVEAGQLLGRLDTTLAREDVLIRRAKRLQAHADLKAAEKTRDETKQRYQTGVDLFGRGGGSAMSKEEVRERLLAWEKYSQEAISKQEAIRVAEAELKQAQTIVDKHDIRSQINGIVKVIYRQPGEAVKQLEPVFMVHNTDKLRVEGLVETQYLPRLRQGMKVVIEASQAEGPLHTLLGHLGEVSGVAVVTLPRGETLIASASEDGTIRLWDRASRRERRVLANAVDGRLVAVRCLAASPPGTSSAFLLTGGTEGTARLWDVEQDNPKPLFELKNQHHGAITCVAFSPDGKFCVTGGDDREVCLWDTATGKFLYSLPQLHKSGITSVQFTTRAQLVTAARDNVLRLWSLDTGSASLLTSVQARGGEVGQLGVSTDGTRVLFDQGKTLRVMSLPGLLTEGAMQNPASGANFSTFALFSPNGQLVLTAGGSEGRLQLWRAPSSNTRGYEIRQLAATDRSMASSAAFDPKGEYIVTGTRTGAVHVWPMPSKQEIEEQLQAQITNLEKSIEGAGRQVRIWAELPNPGNRLIPGNTVTMDIYPEVVANTAKKPE